MEEFRPIDKAIQPKKTEQWHYKIHPFFTKQPANVVGAYIEHFTKKGNLVLDPFCGTGVTAIESLTNKRRVIVMDIDPLAVFITKQTCIAPIDIKNFQSAFNEIYNNSKNVVDFARKAKDLEIEKFKIKDWYPRKVSLPSNSDFDLVENLFDKRQLIVYSFILKEIKKIRNKRIRDLMLFVFSGAIARGNLTHNDGGDVGGGGSSIFAQYRYWKPKRIKVLDAWKIFENRFRIVKKCKEASNNRIGDLYKEGETFIINKYSATKLTDLVRKNSIDYIYTDPPYGAHIAYLDLSTMWNAWLGFKVTEEDKKLEIIEGGDIGHTKDDYLNLLNQAISEMYKVLKKDAWLSLVFHHKEVRLWYAIRDFAKDAGFEYVNTVAQPTATTSIHKKKNPLKVLGEQLIVNFRKSKRLYPVIEPEALPVLKVIYNAAEREIVTKGGATLEEIMRAIVPELFEANLIDKVALKTTSDVSELLAKEFELGPDDRWHIKKENHKRIGQYIDTKNRIRYYLISMLRREKKMDLNRIITELFPKLINGHKPEKKEILDVLEEVAISKDNRNWQLKSPDEIAIQNELDLRDTEIRKVKVPQVTRHNQMIYRLLVLGVRAGFIPYIGKRERETELNETLQEFKYFKKLPLKKLTEDQQRIIEQIDCIWFYKDAPIFAFEIEESTPISTGLQRFYTLLRVESQIGIDRRLVIVVPKSRQRKLTFELSEERGLIGHPVYLEQKIVYMFFEDLEKKFEVLSAKERVDITEIELLFRSPKLLDK
jgi:DNA modification methylase